MPPIAAAVAAYATTAAVSVGFSVATAWAIGSVLSSLVVTSLIQAGVGLLTSSMARKSSAPSVNRLEDINRYLTQSSIESHKIIYGTAKIAGNVSFRGFSNSGEQKAVGGALTTDTSDNLFQHTVITLAGHECEDIIEYYADDLLLTLDADGYATNSEYVKDDKYTIRILKHLGSTTQTADTKLVAEYSDWTTDHRLRGICYIYARFRMTGFTDSLPTIKCVVKGKKVYDPRTATTAWSNNWALCVLDYLISDYGFNADISTEIDTTSFNAAANISDENVNILPSGTQDRYTCDGIVDTAAILVDNLQSLISAGAGSVIYEQGKFKCFAAAYETPTVSITDSWFSGDIELITRKPRTELFNTVKGVFLDPDKDYAATDFPEVTNSTYVTEDGGEKIYSNIELPFTNNVQRAQRIAKIILEKGRQGITATLNLNLKGLQISVWDNVYITNSTLGWSSKIFRVTSWALNVEGGVTITVQEESSASYNWTNTEATLTDTAPDTNLPTASIVPTPTNLVLTSGNSTLYLRNDGTVMSRIKATWDLVSNPYVQYGGQIEIQYKRSSDSEWEKNGYVGGSETFDYILDVEDGIAYDVRVRAKNSIGYLSEWVTVTNHTVVGKTAPPSDVTGLSGIQQGGAIVLQWNEPSDIDLDGYIIKYGQTTANWAGLLPLTETNAGTELSSFAVPAGTYQFCIKAVDTSGNESTNATCITLDVASFYDVIEQQEAYSLWGGTKTNMLRNPLTGHLNPDDQDTATGNSFNVFDNYVMNPYATYSYEATEMDLGADTLARLYSTATTPLGAGESGTLDIEKQIDYKLAAGSYDGFENLNSVTTTFRYAKFKLVMDGTGALAYFQQYTNIVDAEERTESDTSVVISIGGTTINFTQAFNNVPSVIITPISATPLTWVITSLTTSAFTVKVYNLSGTDVGGTINWQAIGV